MLRSLVSRALPLLLVLVLLPWSAAAKPLKPAVKAHPAPAAVSFSRLQSWLLNIWEKNGCGIDPHGLCQPSSATTPQPTADNGCGIDPWGRCTG